MNDHEIIGQSKTMSAFNNNAKNFVLNLFKQYFNLFVYWKVLKDHGEFNVVHRKVMLIIFFFNLRKTDNIIMDVHLT